MCAAPGTCSEGEAHDGLRAYPCRVPSARRTSSTPTAWVSCCTMARCPRCGFRRANCATSASCRAPGPSQAGRTVAFSKIRTALKNRMHATFATPALAGGAREYGLSLDTLSDIYAAKWRAELTRVIGRLPEETRRCMEQELELLDLVQGQIDRLEVPQALLWLCRHGTQSQGQRGQVPLRPDDQAVQQLPEVGVHCLSWRTRPGRRRMWWFGSGITRTGRRSMWCSSTNAPGRGRGMPSLSVR